MYNPLDDIKRHGPPPEIGKAASGWWVKLLRRALAWHGHGSALWRNTANAVSDFFDGPLELIVKNFQHEQGLENTGFVDSATWDALSALAPESPLARGQRLAAHALKDVGVRETGHNSGPRVEEMLSCAGAPRGSRYPWCCAAVHTWAIETLGLLAATVGLSCSGFVRTYGKIGRVITDPTLVIPGDAIVLRGGPTGYRHAGLVVSISGNTVHTVEANTNKAGSAEGDGVYERTRRLARRKDGSLNAVFVRVV